MPSQRNQDQLNKIKDKLETISSLIFVNYTGISVADQQALRKTLSENDNSFSVTKNTLVNLALQDRPQNLPNDIKEALSGPTATVYAQDVVSASKTLTDFTKDHPTFTIKIGLSLSPQQDRILTTEEIQKLSKLPSKDQLYAQLLSQLNAPAQSLVRVLTAPMQNLAYLLQNVVDRG
ncbi:50S ribosomal protein L10 [Patescibacteria group bacterium]|nr:50S ribosomal protein L10 [Patescibacteria group bacterium]MBU1256592.1 50S ribosomal protein L10 [Patescibacteria group bacterium]MBU1457921.1 50S ribosomal protein L10 [Patescibacteria group bacterium]